MRRAFSLIVAVFTILLMSLVATYIFYSSSTISKTGVLQYQKEQAELLARSYTEYAIMAVQGNDRNSSAQCIKKIRGVVGSNPAEGKGYEIEVDISYIGSEKYLTNCNNYIVKLSNSDSDDTLMILVDVYIRYKDLQYKNPSLSPWITYHKRSLQKI